eukprot:14835021-Alexandrium_andersonii.AAC.1
MSYLLCDRHLCVDMYWRQSSADGYRRRGCVAGGLRWVGSGIGVRSAVPARCICPCESKAWA